MSKAMRGYGCVMKRIKKQQGGLSQDKPDIKILNSKPKTLYTEKDRTPKNKISDLKILANKKIKDVRTDKGMYSHKNKTKKGE